MTRRPLWAALLAAAIGTACDDPAPVPQECAISGGTPDYTFRLGCAADYEALGAKEDPFSSFAHTTTVNVLVDREDGNRAYYINTARWWLHFEFVHFVLEGNPRLPPGDPAYVAAHQQFNRDVYGNPNRRYMPGKIVHYRDSGLYLYEVAAGDPAGPDLIELGFRAARDHVYNADAIAWRPVANNQEALIPELAARGVPVVTTDELFAGQTYQPLHQTVGYGTLRFVRTSQLAAATLLPTDIVVLDRVPNDLPVVAGVITGELQTPLSHINVLSRQRGTPNMALRGAFDDAALRARDGELVRLTVGAADYAIERADPADAQAWWDQRRPAEPLTPALDLTVTEIVDLTTVRYPAASFVGAKAANYAELMSVVPELPMPRPAFAIPFAAFHRHMTEHGLWADLDAILADAPVGLDLERRLFALRWKLFQAPMAPETRDAIVALLAAQFGDVPVRFRSSTNAEDLPGFSGAGLYTSAGARLSDGPDAVERAVKAVWASVFNTAAFLERDFYRVDHRRVRMAVLVHAAFKDEQANGVALTGAGGSVIRPAFFINAQAGEVSVANPSGQATPEQILWFRGGPTALYEVLGRSSLTGGAPVLTDEQYGALASLLELVHARIRILHCRIPGSEPAEYDPSCTADVEWKLTAAGELSIKQARPLGTP